MVDRNLASLSGALQVNVAAVSGLTGSEDESKRNQRQSRKRTARACDSCYKRKIKCDAAIPQCDWCSNHNTPCTFERTTQKRKGGKAHGPRQHKPSRLSERLSRVEKLLMDNLLTDSSLSGGSSRSPGPSSRGSGDLIIIPPNQPLASSSTALHFAGHVFGVYNLLTGLPFLLPEGQQWVESRTGQSIAFDKQNPARPLLDKKQTMGIMSLLMDPKLQDPFELPPQGVTETYFDLYRSVPMRVIFPVLDFYLFRETIKVAYHPQHSVSSYRPAGAKACIFAFIAYTSILHPPGFKLTPVNVPSVDSEGFAIRAQCLMPQVLQEPASLDGLQAAMFLSLFELASGSLRSANHYISITSRLVYLLGASTISRQPTTLPTLEPGSLDNRQQRHARNLFWLCYTVDKDIALQTGQPLALYDESCDLTLPPDYEKQLHTSMECFHLPGAEVPPIYPIDLRLSIIKSRAYSTLYSLKGLQKTDAELLKEIRELDDCLERWRVSVPLEMRPTLTFSHERPDPNVNMHSLIHRMNYYLCMSIIHQASSRCKAWTQNQGRMIEGVRSSLALSVGASRSTLMYLEAAEHVLMGGVFCHLIFYPMSAVLTVFCNILHTPSDQQASKDLSLLRETAGMMERISLRRLCSVNEVIHIKAVADFVSELHRLASCAIEKAANEHFG